MRYVRTRVPLSLYYLSVITEASLLGRKITSRRRHPGSRNWWMTVEIGMPLLVILTDGGMSTDGREEHPTKTFWWISVTDDGMVTDVREEQPWKAYSPIDVTDDGTSTDVREEQRQKA